MLKGVFDTGWIPYRFNPGGLGSLANLESWKLGRSARLESWRSEVMGVLDTRWIPYIFNPGGLGA